MKPTARVLSILLHPLWMPFYLFVLAFVLVPQLSFFMPQKAVWFNHAVILVMTGVFPLLGALVLLRGRRLAGITMDDRRQRISPMIGALMYHVLTYWLIRKYPHHPAALSLFLGCALSVLVVLLITLGWKVSAHMAGIGGLLGGLVALQWRLGTFPILFLIPLVIVAGLLGSARLFDSDHTPAQLYVGILVGFACVFGSVVAGVVL